MSNELVDLITDIRKYDGRSSTALGTAQWMMPDDARERLTMRPDTPSDRIWIGEACEAGNLPLGYADDRHVCLVSGTRGGKGTGVIVPNLSLWPGSAVVIDPKGENATVTAQRRGAGSAYARGMGQEVRILDPFGEVQLDPALRARFNPLDVINAAGDFAIDDAGRVAAAIIVRENQNDPFFEEAARNLMKGLILHVLTDKIFDGRRNLLSVRRLATQGDWLRIAKLREAGEKDLPSGFMMLWKGMQRSEAFDGVIAGVGEQMIGMAEKTRSGVLETLRTNTVFLDGAPMQRLLEASDFDLAGIKTNPKGLTLYLTLPQRYMDTHFRWLRLMVSLAIGEMERIKGRPKAGSPTLFLLDEFAGLKRMEVVENAVAQAAGFGAKFFFVLQNLPQLKQEYGENWETFVSNSGLKLFFQIDDHFTRDYVTKLLGEREVRRETRSGSQSSSDSTSNTVGESATRTSGTSDTKTTGGSKSRSHQGKFLFWWRNESWQEGDNNSKAAGTSVSDAAGTSTSRADSRSTSNTTGWSDGVHKRSLLNPDELGRFFARVDDANHPAYPGLMLAVMPGQHPLIAKRINYFQSRHFAGRFDPHPDHPRPRTLAEEASASSFWDRPVRKLSLDPWTPPDVAQPAPKRGWLSADEKFILRLLAFPFIGLWRLLRFLNGKPAARNAARPGGRVKRFAKGVVTTSVRGTMILAAIALVIGVAAFLQFPEVRAQVATQVAKVITLPDALLPAAEVAYRDGGNDRRSWTNWMTSLDEDAREGARYWILNMKSDPNCVLVSANRDYVKGCLDAKDFMTKVNARRQDDEDYRRGWNDSMKKGRPR